MSGLLDVLGLPAPAGTGRGVGGAGSVADALATAPVMRADSRAGDSPKRDPRLEEIDKIIEDPEKRLKALADRKIPRFAAEFDAESKETAFLKDLQEGTKKAKEYVDFIEKASDYAQQFGDFTQSEQIKSAAANLKKVTTGVLGGLSTFTGIVGKVKDLVTFYEAFDEFADASLALDMQDRASVTAWAKSIKTLWNAGGPFVDWAKSKALSAAFAGSKVAGIASATLSIVGAQIFVGLEALNAGLANVNAYIDKMNARMRQIEEESGQRPRTPKPKPPAPWKSRGEEAAEARRREDAALRDQVYQQISAEKAAARQKAEEERKAAEAKNKAEEAKKKAAEEATRRVAAQVEVEYRDAVFPAMWVKSLRDPLRRKLRRDLIAEYRANGTGDSNAYRCYECFEASGDEAIGDDIYIPKVSGRVGIDGARREIAKFSALGTCDDFNKVAATARKAFDAKRGAGKSPP
jgi:hypothetical protein